jgi:chromosome segregation protein
VRLSKLKLAGFKTFVDPTTVLAPGNLVGVVGPNGCGKSNIIDAVRWVLGESRASALRGESMQDVIFNGSTTRKPVSRASVELVFDNAEGKAAGQWSRYAEISVKRVLERSGDSSYFINSVHVRRKDVIDLFLGTGLGPRAYAIIEQGMISRIIEAKPEEIRGFLEEAAGVTKYRERRRETEGRLSDARDNLARLDDIRTELGERVEHLGAQALIAAKYRELSQNLEQRQQVLWLLKREQAGAELEGHRAELASLSSQLEQGSARLQELEVAVEQARDAHFASVEATHQAQADLYAASGEVRRLEAELRHLEESRNRIEKRIAELEAEELHWSSRRESLVSDRGRWVALQENTKLRVERSEARHDEVAERLPAAETARQVAETTVNAARRELGQTEQQLRVEETRRASAARALDAIEQRKLRLQTESGQIEGPDEVAVATRQARVDSLEESLHGLHASLERCQQRLPEEQAGLKLALDEDRAVQRRITEHRARRDALAQLQARVQSQGKLGDWLKRHGLEGLQPLWRGLRVAAGWEAAVEAVLRERLGALTGDVAPAVAALFEQNPPESLAILLPDAGPEGRDSMAQSAAPAGASWLTEHVEVLDPALGSAVREWLGDCLAVDSLSPWVARRAGLAPGIALVSRDGQLLTRSALVHRSPDSRTHGVIERQREIDALDAALEILESEADQAHEGLQNAEKAVAAITEESASLRRAVQVGQQALHAEQVDLLKLTQAMQRAEERRTQIGRDLADLAGQLASESDHLMRAETEHARCAELADLQRQQHDAALEVFDERDRALRELRTLETAAARELQEAHFAERECAGKLEDVARNLQLADEQLRRISLERDARDGELEATDDHRSAGALQQALTLSVSREQALAACREAQEQAAARLKSLEESRLRCEQEAAPQRNRVGELRLAAQAAELAVAQFDERLKEAGADEAALLPLLDDNLREAGLQREVARLGREIAELGQVNLAALDELRSAQERKAYLDAQTDDLTRAIDTLEDAIRRIDRETREQLQETYDTVNGHFGRLFPQLFGGGQARLVLTGEEILDAGIQIVAQPPGKKNASIHLLSGGEKALTAIALVFSMFQLNPAPFCMLDEVDAPLDDANTERYCQMVRRMSSQTQFIFISHNKVTMEIAQQLVGVTMQEQGVSRVVEVDIEEALRLAETVEA